MPRDFDVNDLAVIAIDVNDPCVGRKTGKIHGKSGPDQPDHSG